MLTVLLLAACRPDPVEPQPPAPTHSGDDTGSRPPTACDEVVWYADGDGDGWGDPATATSSCVLPPDAVARGGDCDDADPLRSPDAVELCNLVDDDCDPATTEDGLITVFAADGSPRIGSFSEPADAVVTLGVAGPGAVMNVCPGTWTDGLDLSPYSSGPQDITLVAPHGPEVTILDDSFAPDDGMIVLRDEEDRPPRTLTLVGFTLRGSIRLDPLLLVEQRAPDVHLEDCVIERSTVSAIVVRNATDEGRITLVDTVFRDNVGFDGAAISMAATSWDPAAAARIEATNVEFARNAGERFGGAVNVGDGAIVCTDCTFADNTVSERYGSAFGAAVYASVGGVELSGGTLDGNTGAAAIHLADGATLTADTVGLLDNDPTDVEVEGVDLYEYGAAATFSCDASGCR